MNLCLLWIHFPMYSSEISYSVNSGLANNSSGIFIGEFLEMNNAPLFGSYLVKCSFSIYSCERIASAKMRSSAVVILKLW